MKYLILGLIPLLTFCKNAEPTTSESKTVVDHNSATTEDAILSDTKKGYEVVNLGTHIKTDFQMPAKPERVTVLNAVIENDSLKLSVQFGGGCRKHEFMLISDGNYMESDPPKLNMYLDHQHNDDACRALIQEELAFDLSAIRYAVGNKIILNISGWEAPLTYTY